MATKRFVAKHDEFSNLVFIGYTSDGRPMYAAELDAYKNMEYIGTNANGEKMYRAAQDSLVEMVLIGYTDDGRPMYASPVDTIKNYHIAIAYEEYFGEMELSDAEIERRIKLARDLDDEFWFLFWLWINSGETVNDGYELDIDYIQESGERRFKDALKKHGYTDKKYPELNQRIKDGVKNILDVTERHFLDPWYLSEDRANAAAENDTNAYENYKDFTDKRNAGYTKKTWHTMLDDRVRHSHMLNEGETVGIDDLFTVGMWKMRYPKDKSEGAADTEIFGCRCSVSYSR